MSVIESDIQWFVARDGKQHGPLSDAEMRKLMELGHLRQTDLIWRLGFPDWRPVATVFPLPAEGSHRDAPATPAPSHSEPSAPYPTSGSQSAAIAPRQERTAGQGAGRPAPTVGERVAATPGDSTRWSQPAAVEPPRKAGRSRRTFVIAASLLALTSAGAWLGYQNRDALMSVTAASKQVEPAPQAAVKATFETAAVPADEGTAALDAEFQKRPLWTAIKQEFPEWYDVRLKEVAKLGAEGKPELEITQHWVEAIVSLRRQHADKALAASTEKHKELASAFLNNLKTLSEAGAETCYGFISKGETSAGTIALMQTPEKSAQLEAQVVAVIAAIADGRKSPVTHAAPLKSDYDVLAAELGHLGWTQADMQLFADPKALARAPHERVCKMVQDWFAAHLAIQDSGIQERLLFETLRPVVAG